MIALSKGATTPSDNTVVNDVEIEALEDVRNRRERLTGALADRFSELQQLRWASGSFDRSQISLMHRPTPIDGHGNRNQLVEHNRSNGGSHACLALNQQP